MKRQLSEEASSQIKRLYEIKRGGFLSIGQSSKMNAMIDLIEGAKETAEPAVIPFLLPYCFHPWERVSESAVEVVEALHSLVPNSEMTWLDERVRTFYPPMRNEMAEYWYRLAPTSLSGNVALRSSPVLLSLCCGHHSGYVREKCLDLLQACPPDTSFTTTLIRANDWVQKVRLKAYTQLWVSLDLLTPNALVTNLPLIMQLSERGRGDHGQLLEKVEQICSSERCHDALFKAIETADRDVSRAAFQIAAQVEALAAGVLPITAEHGDNIIRIRSLRLAEKTLADDALLRYLNQSVKDRMISIQKISVYIMLQRFPEYAEEILVKLLTSRVCSLRELARFYLKRYGWNHFDHYYRKLLGEGRIDDVGVIQGIGECGNLDDWSEISSLLDDQRPKVRAAAITACGNLRPDGWQQTILERITASHPADIKAAALVIEKNRDDFPLHDLETAYRSASNNHAKNKLLKIVMQYQRWDSLGFLIRMYQIDDGNEVLGEKLQQWLGYHRKKQIFTLPPKRLLAELPTVISLLESEAVHSGLINEFRWLLSRGDCSK